MSAKGKTTSTEVPELEPGNGESDVEKAVNRNLEENQPIEDEKVSEYLENVYKQKDITGGTISVTGVAVTPFSPLLGLGIISSGVLLDYYGEDEFHSGSKAKEVYSQIKDFYNSRKDS